MPTILYVANDYGRNNLYRNDDGRFVDIAAEAGVEDQAAGMSVAWSDYKAMAKERGALALELFVAESTPQKGPEELKAVLPDHLAYQRTLEERGVLAFAGPMSDETGEEMSGTGLIVYRAASFDEARALAQADPMHQTGTRRFTLRRWLINEGSLTLSVGLSTRSVGLE